MTQTQPQRIGPRSRLRDIAYCMDALVPGIYAWWGNHALQIGGCSAESSYPGTIHAARGIAIVLPGYRILSTYRGDHDRIEAIYSDDRAIVITAYHPSMGTTEGR